MIIIHLHILKIGIISKAYISIVGKTYALFYNKKFQQYQQLH